MGNKMTAQMPTATSNMGPVQVAFLTGGLFAVKEVIDRTSLCINKGLKQSK